jgi:hypothetical protein
MKIIVEGNLLSLYKAPDFRDKDSGEVKSEGKYKLQLLVETQLSNGDTKQEMQDISIPDDKVPEYKAQIGKKVQVKCNYVSKSPVNFYVS